MDKVILLLGHGSRDPESQAGFLRLTRLVQQRMESVKVQAAFLELCDPLVPQGISTCIQAGAEKIVAIPVFLSDASHVKKDLPVELNEARAQHPGVAILYGRPLGMGQPIREILLERLQEAVSPIQLEAMAILLVGRGSPDSTAVREVEEVAGFLKGQLKCRFITVAFVDRSRPSVPEGLKACEESGAKAVLVLPCLLFPGVVLNRIHQAVQEFKSSRPDLSFIVAPCLGVHPKLVELVMTRIRQCDQPFITP